MREKELFGHAGYLMMGFIAVIRRSAGVAAMTTGVLLSFRAVAQTESQPPGQTNDLASESYHSQTTRMAPDQALTGCSLDYSYVGGGNVAFSGASGRSDAQSINFNAGGRTPINDKWFIPLGLDSHNLFLGTVAGAPIPSQINTLGLNAGLGYRFNDKWTLAGVIGPRIYRFDDFGSDDVGLGGTIRAVYQMRPNLALAFGLNFETDRQPPVLPAAGLRWDIRTNLMLTLMWPRSGLTYRVNDKLDIFAGAGGDFAVFRTAPNLGNTIGQSAYNNALGTYRDFRLGAGVDYRLLNGLSVTLEGGYSIGREIDYHNIGQTVSFGNSPYVQVGLRYRF